MKITKQFREKLDSLIQNAKSIKNSPETTLAWRSLQLAKAWLGKAAQWANNGSVVDTGISLDAVPYLPSGTVEGIPPTANVATGPSSLGTDQLANINLLRDEIQAQIDAIETNRPSGEKQRNCWDKCIEHLTEAKFWYGFELAEMREKALGEVKDVVATFLAVNPEVVNRVAPEMANVQGLPELIAEKISENENTSSKEEPSDAPPEKG